MAIPPWSRSFRQALAPLLLLPLTLAPALPADTSGQPGEPVQPAAKASILAAVSGKPAVPDVYPYFAAAARTALTPVYADPGGTILLARLAEGEEYPVLTLDGDRYKLQLLGGKTGYASKNRMTLRPLKRYVLGWNAYGDRETFLAQNQAATSVNAVSPRWFFLDKETSPITASPDAAYVSASHKLGQEVWPLFGNRFDSDLTDAFLSSPDKRKQAVSTLLGALMQSGADGINVDFENIQPGNKNLYTAFIGELAAALHPHGLKVTVDVTRTNPDPYWSGSLDRAQLGKVADYLILMDYDEHYEGAPEAGSTASLPWVREGIELLLQGIPAQKVILGVPFYTRDWTTSAAGGVDSTYLSAKDAAALVLRLGLPPVWDAAVEQNMVSYTASGATHRIWLEDAGSMQRRTALVPEYALRGAAAWYMGEETPELWPAFAKLTPAGPAEAVPSYPDLDGHWARESVLALSARRVVTGTGEGLFEPERPVTRAEFAALLSRLYIGGNPAVDKTAASFKDVPASGWYAGSASLLAGLGVLSGYPDGSFQPDAPITREEMAAMISRLMSLTADLVPLSSVRQEELLRPFRDRASLTWSREAAAVALDQGIVKGRSADLFEPRGLTTRAEAAVMLERLQGWLSGQPGYDFGQPK